MVEGQIGYVIAAYVFTALTFTLVIGWVLLDRAKQKKQLAALEARGITRARQGR